MLGMKLGLSPAAGLFQGANEIWRWTPAQLFAGGVAGFWPARFDPAGQKLWQDALASARALVAGDPVGKVERAFGTADAAQTTALSRPALGRWPKGAKPRNLARDSANLTGTAWTKSQCTIDSTGKVTSTGNGSGGNGFPTIRNVTLVPYKVGDKITVSATVWRDTASSSPVDHYSMELPAAMVGGTSKNAQFNMLTGAVHSTSSGVTASIVSLGGGKYRIAATFTAVATWNVDGFFCNFFLGLYASQPAGVTGYIENPQIEIGESATPYQATDADGVPLAGYGQVRNLATGAQAVDDPTYWRQFPSTASGVYQGVINHGVEEDGIPFVDVLYEGTPTATALASTYVHNLSITPATEGEVFTSSMYVKIIGGSGDNVDGIRCETVTAKDGSYLRAIPSAVVKPTNYELVTATGGITPSDTALGANQVRTAVVLRAVVGQPINITVRIKGLQFERGSVVTPLQHNYGPNNITEPGGEDVWFLVNDGNDALPVSLPAGTYEIAWVNPAGGISYATQTLSSAGTIDALRGTRMADVIIRQGDFTAAEKALIEAEWSKIAA